MSRKQALSPDRMSNLVMRGVSALFALFLILLANQIIMDLGHWVPQPDRAATAQNPAAQKTATDKASLRALSAQREAESQALQSAVDLAGRDYTAQKEGYDNWIKARKTIGSPNQDAEILSRVHALDDKMATRHAWEEKLAAAEVAQRDVDEQLDALASAEAAQRDADYRLYAEAMSDYQFHLFAWRMAIVLPFLMLGVYAFLRWRKAKYAALAWGYIIFAAYTFFVGVVPYLPSFSGYFRFVAGALLTGGGGVYVVRTMQEYTERKRLELLQSSAERAQKIGDEAARAAFQTHICPSCDHDYRLPIAKSGGDPTFCYHCGLELFGQCASCGEVNFVHFNHCTKCGETLKHTDANHA